MTAAIKIGSLAKRTGTTAPTIRYYEEIGLLPKASRQMGSQRIYGEDDAQRLTFIRRCRAFGFSIEQVRLLTSLVQDRDRSCDEARDLAQSHLLAIRDRLAELQQLEQSISAFVESCDRSCAGGPGPDCTIIDGLGVDPPKRGCNSGGSSRSCTQAAPLNLPTLPCT